MGELKLTQIWIYPIKSLGGIQLPEAQVMGKGLRYDRRWMLIDDTLRALTQRDHPLMALFKLKFYDAGLTITFKDDSINIPFSHSSIPSPLDVQIWDDTITALEVSKEHSEWFSDRMNTTCRLVVFPEENRRQIEPALVPTPANVSLADSYPFLIIGQSSLDDLNARLDNPVAMKRFRPNFVFTGGQPYAEDCWKDFTIGATRFRGIRPSSRCVLITIDPETGVKGKEPLRTLATYRRWNNKTYFGQNAISIDHTVIRAGDVITLQNSYPVGKEQLAGTSDTRV